MSQKYKSFSRGNGRNSSCGSSLPPGVKRMGYLRKLKKMKRRFFILHMESNYGVARLEYYSSEKKWKFGCEPRRCIELKSCLNISRKLHSKHKNVIALYTQDDCFSVVAESSEDLELWLNDLLEVQRTFIEVDENARWRPIYEHLWQVVIDKHDLEYDRLFVGPYRVALSSKSLFLIKMNPLNENDYFEFPLMSIRRCGHSKDHFFIELGRSSVIGAGEIYMATEGTIVAQNMHETVLSAMKSSKIREDGNPPPRPRSASTSENSNPVAVRRPIAPQTVSASISSSGLSNSRERCDSLPTRPQTVTGNSHNSVLSALSSPYTSSGSTFRKLSPRPHSMYEWPSCNSPSARNASFSPSSLSSTTACSSSTEEIDKMKYQSFSCSHSLSTDSKASLECRIPELSDDYLKMSVTDEFSSRRNGPDNRNPNEISTRMPDYMDMESSKVPIAKSVIKPGNFLPNPQSSVSDGIAVKDGYLDMSPSNSLPKDAPHICSFRQDASPNFDSKGVKDQTKKRFELEQVLSFFKMEENVQSTSNNAVNNRPTVIKKDDSFKSPISLVSNPDHAMRITSEEVQLSLNNNAIIGTKPPIPERTYHKHDNKNSVCPPLPMRKGELGGQLNQQSKTSHLCKAAKDTSVGLQNKQDLSLDFSNKNSELDDQDVFYDTSNSVKYKSVISPGQNTNFSCLHSGERSSSRSLPCAPICSATKTMSNTFKAALSKTEQNEGSRTHRIHKTSTNKFSSSKNVCDNSEVQLPADTAASAPSKSKLNADSAQMGDQNSNIPSAVENVTEGDYMNIDFKSNSPPLNQIKPGYLMPKHNSQLLPPCLDTNHPSYSNIQFGKPFCPSPKPIPASGSATGNLAKTEWAFSFPNYPKPCDDGRGQAVARSSTGGADSPKCAVVTPMLRNIPNTLPAFRKQMSAPAAPPSLRPELPSPGRKSSCPVTASASMIRPSLPGTSICSMLPGTGPMLHGVHLKVSTSRSPDHSSVSSISSASDEISSAHSSPKTLSQNFCVGNRQVVAPVRECTSQYENGQYENVVIPQRSSASSRPASTSSEEKELNYALLDLAPSEDTPRSPTIHKPMLPDNEETLTYAQIDFTKSEGLKNTSGNVREGRL